MTRLKVGLTWANFCRDTISCMGGKNHETYLIRTSYDLRASIILTGSDPSCTKQHALLASLTGKHEIFRVAFILPTVL